ncbi:hypothetical protein MMC22_005925 [Lobaria immixta]|nr:hypothetical protein [Lobaria immixta]
MAAAVANQTCDAFAPITRPCTLGNMVAFTVNASTPLDFSKTIQFAKAKNIRLVVRNTGHDYLGKSTGAGGLSIWTHHLKNIDFLNYHSEHYSGRAVKYGAGVQGMEAYAATAKNNEVVVGGDCATVGPVGGYSQGGGHSALSSKFGLGADQALEWEVVDGHGRFLKASRTENPDLYWALSGGGGGTYGVVYSLTVKVYPGFPVTGVVLNFTTHGVSLDTFYDAIGDYHKILPTWTAAGGTTIAQVSNASFLLTPVTFPNISKAEATSLMKPYTDRLSQLGIVYHLNITTSATYLEHYNRFIEPNPSQLVENGQYGGRFIPLSVIEESNDNFTAAIRKITQDGVGFVGIGLNVSSKLTGGVHNSVHPSWRTAAVSVLLSSSWPSGTDLSPMKTLAKRMTDEWVPALTALAPDSGCYMNEADPQTPNWKKDFYGPNYNRLYAVKQKYDPDHLFYAPTAVGSDHWQESSSGALCRA